LKEAKLKTDAMVQNCRQSKNIAAKWQKQYTQAVASREKAILNARNIVIQEKSVHNLLKKGVYTEETHNLMFFSSSWMFSRICWTGDSCYF
jgi:hypothetical protein